MFLSQLLLFVSCPAFSEPPLRGFDPVSGKSQHEIERRLRTLAEAPRLRSYMQRMTSKAHHAGSSGSRQVAEYALSLFQQWGFDARLETFEALLPYPKSTVVEMLDPVRYRATLREPPLAEDPDSGSEQAFAAFHAYAGDGDVSGPLLYVNYGLPEDYAALKRMGLSAEGKIVLARYGKSWRGTKAKVAYENGALACLIYSDPRDDGYFQGDVYPNGPYRPLFAVQRGSVLDMPIRVGDPQTPGWGSTPGAKRISKEESGLVMKLPVVPLSYGEAQPLLEQLKGPVAPEAWRGALALTYHLGPGPARVRVKTESDWSVRPVHNVIATMAGSLYPDQWILYGNHHDAWVRGANDPASGASVLLETARSLAELRKTGWTPKRTLMFALWDAEEFGLIGSTEWVEKHRDELDRKMVAYLNTDATGRGPILGAGSKSLESFYQEALRDVLHPETGLPLLAAGQGKRSETSSVGKLSALGAGSDYVAFLHHAGIASLNLGFGSEGGGVYHSSYDTFTWYSRFSDGDFRWGRTLSGLLATLLVRLAGAAVLPFDFLPLAQALEAELTALTKSGAGPSSHQAAWKELLVDVQSLTAAAKAFESEFQLLVRRASRESSQRLGSWNQAIYRLEREWLSESGLPGRSWYRHQLHAPGLYTGYGVQTLPGIREALDNQQWDEVARQRQQLRKSVRAFTDGLRRLTASMRLR